MNYVKAPVLRRMGTKMLRTQRKDGTEFLANIRLSLLELAGGSWILVTLTADDDKQEVNFHQVIDAAVDAVLLVNKEGFITMANQQAITLFGYPNDELVGHNVEMLLPEKDRVGRGEMIRGFFTQSRTRFMGVGREFAARRKDGTEFPAEIGLSAVEIKYGMLTMTTITDIVVRRQREHLRGEKKAVKAIHKAKSDFLAIANNHLKDPLVAVTDLAEFLLAIKKSEPSASKRDMGY